MPRVVIRQPHYIDGRYHHATPEYPAVVDVDEKWFPRDAERRNPDMQLHEEGEKVEGAKLGKHFSDAPKQHVQSSAQAQSEPKPLGKPGRASDKQPV